MSLFGTNLTKLIFLQRTIQERQFPELLLLVNVLFVVDNHQHLLDHVGGRVDGILIVPGNDHMEWFIVTIHNFPIATSAGTFFDGSSTPNGDFAARLGFQFLLGFSPWSDDQSNEVIGWMLVQRDSYLSLPLPGQEIGLTPRSWVHVDQLFEYVLSLVRVALSPPFGPSVLTLAIGTVDGRRRWGSFAVSAGKGIHSRCLGFEAIHLVVDFSQPCLQTAHFLLLVRGQVRWDQAQTTTATTCTGDDWQTHIQGGQGQRG